MGVAALVMAGGRGSRFSDVDKGSIKVCGKPMVMWVLSNIVNAGIGEVVMAVSARNRDTLSIVRGLNCCDVYMSSGVNYVVDLSFALRLITKRPILVMPIDVPLIPPEVILDFINKGISIGKPVVNMVGPHGYVGVTLFNDSMGEWVDVKYDSPVVMDIDTPSDLKMAEELCGGLGNGVNRHR